jgi:hypothetical protein
MSLSFTMLPALGSAIVLKSHSRGTHDHILLSQFRASQTWRPGLRIYTSQEQDGLVTLPGTGIHFRRLLRLANLL